MKNVKAGTSADARAAGAFRSKFKRGVLALCIFCLTTLAAVEISAQTAEPAPEALAVVKKRPKIGLVLSGGGARGFAHIGVLKALEENHVPVDYISGASMGALIGALYATGRTPDEMEKLVENLDWDELLRGKPTLDDLTFRRKQDRRNLPGAITLGGKSIDLRLPSSLNPGHEIGLVLDRLMLPYGDVTDFSRLPVPFRAVATDLVNAETIVLKSGSLAQALRATMAIPAVFAPVELNGRILADGGILNNIPTDVARAMGADIILVVNIETQLGDRNALQDLVGILGQTFYVATAENSRRSLRQADIIVAPDLKNYSTFDFGAGSEIVKLGYEGALAKAGILQSLALGEDEWREYLKTRQTDQRSALQLVPEFLKIEGTENENSIKKIESKLAEKYDGVLLDQTALERDLTELTGTERFDNIGYGIARRDDQTGLLVRVYDPKERTERRTVLEVGVDVNNTDNDDVNFNARARLTFFDAFGDGNEWRNDFSVGSRTVLATEFYRPFGTSRFFAAPNALYLERRVNFYDDGNRLAEYTFRTAEAGIDLGFRSSRSSELRFGYSIGHRQAFRRIGSPQFPAIGGKRSLAALTWNYDTRDSAQVPRGGVEFKSALRYFFDSPGADYNFSQAETELTAFRALDARNTIFGFGAAGTSFGKRAPLFEQFTIGGLFNVGGYGSGEFRASNQLRGGIGLLREAFAAPAYIGGKLYFGGWYEAGSAFETFGAAKYRRSVTGGAILETRIGPIFLGGSFGEGGGRKLYFSLGRFF